VVGSITVKAEHAVSAVGNNNHWRWP
jgi:hypothetical protein